MRGAQAWLTSRGPLGTIGACGTALQTPFLEQRRFRDTDVSWARLQRHTRKLNVAAQRRRPSPRGCFQPACQGHGSLHLQAGHMPGLCRFLGDLISAHTPNSLSLGSRRSAARRLQHPTRPAQLHEGEGDRPLGTGSSAERSLLPKLLKVPHSSILRRGHCDRQGHSPERSRLWPWREGRRAAQDTTRVNRAPKPAPKSVPTGHKL